VALSDPRALFLRPRCGGLSRAFDVWCLCEVRLYVHDKVSSDVYLEKKIAMAARAHGVAFAIKVAVCRSSAVFDTLACVPYDTIAYRVFNEVPIAEERLYRHR
jgi:hypothetical protein